ncbi:hypothetical protein F5Y12DRAFT_284933 [Xylaria sp. FL1777]|nr:hypothetical protein F5Y12DRAFT_284933 [Xylaria sp. FL1777]
MSSLNYRTGQNVCSASCPVEHIDIPGDKIKQPSKSWPDIRGLNSLNYSRDKWLTGDAIEVSIAEYCSGLPKDLQDKIGLGIPGINPKVFHQGPGGDEVLAMAIQTRAGRRVLARLKTTPFSIFPICTNSNHWVLVIMCKDLRETGKDGQKEWSHVTNVAILDPYRQGPRMKMVDDRLRRWLMEAGDFTYGKDYQKIVWVPLQKDGTSCGPRAYWNAKQLIDRLLTFFEAGIEYSQVLWNDLSGWFNEDFVRGEMTGRCAWAAVRAMDYNARMAVECVNRVRNYEDAKGVWKSADMLMRPADFSNAKPEKRPHTYKIVHITPPDTNMPAKVSSTVSPTDILGPNGHNKDTDPAEDAWKPPVPVPNQHKIAPGVVPGNAEYIILDSDDDVPLSQAKFSADTQSANSFSLPQSKKATKPANPAAKPGNQTSGPGQKTNPQSSSSIPFSGASLGKLVIDLTGGNKPKHTIDLIGDGNTLSSNNGKHTIDLGENGILFGPKKRKLDTVEKKGEGERGKKGGRRGGRGKKSTK